MENDPAKFDSNIGVAVEPGDGDEVRVRQIMRETVLCVRKVVRETVLWVRKVVREKVLWVREGVREIVLRVREGVGEIVLVAGKGLERKKEGGKCWVFRVQSGMVKERESGGEQK